MSQRTIRVGFVELTDCAPLVVALERGLFAERGLHVQLVRQPSWTATRDALGRGTIDAAHCLFSLPFSAATGIGAPLGGPRLKIAMGLASNGQAITLSRSLAATDYGDTAHMAEIVKLAGAGTFAMTYPGGTHDIWLRCWLDACGIKPEAYKAIPIPPPQMVANLIAGNVDGYCVGEPWNAVAARAGFGFTAIASQDIWEHHPEKALVVNPAFADERRSELKQLMAALLDACRFADDAANVAEVACLIGSRRYVNAAPHEIEGRMLGEYEIGLGIGDRTFGERRVRFFRGGETTFPRRGHAIWFLAQFVRFGYLDHLPDAVNLADELILSELYAEAAAEQSVPVPDDGMLPFEIKLGGRVFDPAAPLCEVAHG